MQWDLEEGETRSGTPATTGLDEERAGRTHKRAFDQQPWQDGLCSVWSRRDQSAFVSQPLPACGTCCCCCSLRRPACLPCFLCPRVGAMSRTPAFWRSLGPAPEGRRRKKNAYAPESMTHFCKDSPSPTWASLLSSSKPGFETSPFAEISRHWTRRQEIGF